MITLYSKIIEGTQRRQITGDYVEIGIAGS